jgi:hypothetical protein
MFRSILKDGSTNNIFIQGSQSQSSNDVAGIIFQNYDDDNQTTYDMASISLKDHFGDSNSNGFGDIAFKTSGLDHVLTEHMRISYNGNIGIHTSVPLYPLHIMGDLCVTGSIICSNLLPTLIKGDLVVHDGMTNTRLEVGTLGQYLGIDSDSVSGIKWMDGNVTTSTNFAGNAHITNMTVTGHSAVKTLTATGASTFTTLSAGATTVGTLSAGATSVTTLSAGATNVAALSAAATTVTTLNVAGASLMAGLTATGPAIVASLTATGATILTTLTAGATSATTLTAGATTLAALSAGPTTVGTFSAGATSVTTLSAGATNVAALSAAAASVTTLNVTGASIMAALTTSGPAILSSLTTTGATILTTLTAGATSATTLTAGATTLGTLTAGPTTVGTLSAGATSITTLSAGATNVAALSAAAASVTTLNVTGAAIIYGATTLAAVTAQTLTVSGNITKGTGSFVIDHPDPEKHAIGMSLKHCFVESPTRGENIYRFKITTKNKTFTLKLPSYFKFINENVQGWVSPNDILAYGMCKISPDLTTAQITVSDDGDFNVLIIGTRCDDLAKTYFDDTGGAEFFK